MKPQHLIYLFFALTLALFSACNELYEFTVTQSGKDILFTLKDVDLGRDRLMLYDISVANKKCTEPSCVAWELVRHVEDADTTKINSENTVSATIKYGQEFANMEIRHPAAPLTAGSYVIGATFAVIRNNKIVATKLVSGSFKLAVEDNNIVLK